MHRRVLPTTKPHFQSLHRRKALHQKVHLLTPFTNNTAVLADFSSMHLLCLLAQRVKLPFFVH